MRQTETVLVEALLVHPHLVRAELFAVPLSADVLELVKQITSVRLNHIADARLDEACERELMLPKAGPVVEVVRRLHNIGALGSSLERRTYMTEAAARSVIDLHCELGGLLG